MPEKAKPLNVEALKALVRTVPDFPKPGILFYDITTVLKDKTGFAQLIDALAAHYIEERIDLVLGIEARGFIFGPALAYRLNAGFVPVRKPRKLPAPVARVTYDLEYGSDTLEIHMDAIKPGQRVVLVDDLLATGGTMEATVKLVKQLGGEIAGLAFAVELDFSEGPRAVCRVRRIQPAALRRVDQARRCRLRHRRKQFLAARFIDRRRNYARAFWDWLLWRGTRCRGLAVFLQHLRIGETIADIDIREEIDRTGRIVFDLLAQLANEGAQIFDLFPAIGPPDGGQQPRVGDHAPGTAHQAIEDVVFLAGEVNRLAALGDAAACGNEADLADFDGSIFDADRRMHAAMRGADAGDEFADAERLSDVVVGAQFERFDLFFLAFENGHHEHGQARCEGTDAAQRLDAADTGHIDVEQDDVDRSGVEQLQRLFAPRRLVDLEAEFAEGRPQGAANGGFVVDDENTNDGLIHSSFPLLYRSGDGCVKGCAFFFIAGDPDIPAMDEGRALGDGKTDAGSGCAVGRGGGAVVAIEDAFAVGHGNDRTEAVHRKDHFGFGLQSANGDGGAEDRILAGVIDVLREQHAPSAAGRR